MQIEPELPRISSPTRRGHRPDEPVDPGGRIPFML